MRSLRLFAVVLFALAAPANSTAQAAEKSAPDSVSLLRIQGRLDGITAADQADVSSNAFAFAAGGAIAGALVDPKVPTGTKAAFAGGYAVLGSILANLQAHNAKLLRARQPALAGRPQEYADAYAEAFRARYADRHAKTGMMGAVLGGLAFLAIAVARQ